MAVEINAKTVKELRDKTGVGFMECKKALLEAEGDLNAAVKVLRERGVAKAEKRAGRTAAEGLIQLRVSDDSNKATLVELNSETDFVARNDQFQAFLQELSDFIWDADSASLGLTDKEAATGESILELPYPANPGHTLRETLVDRIAKCGENLVFRRFARLESSDNGHIVGYIHPPGKIGVLVELEVSGAKSEIAEALSDLGKDLAMHIAASSPLFLNRDGVDPKVLENEREIYTNKARNEGKPEKILPKIVEGLVQKYLKDVCLVDQVFVKDSKMTISKLLAATSQKVGQTISIKRYIRFQIGVGDDES